MSSESKSKTNSGTGFPVKKINQEWDVSTKTDALSFEAESEAEEAEMGLMLTPDQARDGIHAMECEWKERRSIDDLIPIQPTIEEMVGGPTNKSELIVINRPSLFTTSQLRTAFFTKLRKNQEKEPFSKLPSIQDSLDELSTGSTEQTRQHGLIDYLKLSSFLLEIANLAGQSWRRFPSLPVAAAAEVFHPKEESPHTLLEKFPDSSAQRKKDSPKLTVDAYPASSLKPFGSSKTEKGFLKAIRKKDIQKISSYLDRPGFNLRLNIADKNGFTPIFHAVESGEISIVKSLMQAGANIEAQTPSGDTPLTIAAYSHKPKVIDTLLSKHAKFDHSNKQGKRALDIIIELRETDFHRTTDLSYYLLYNYHVLLVFQNALLNKDTELALKALNAFNLSPLEDTYYVKQEVLSSVVVHAVVNQNLEVLNAVIEQGYNVNLHPEGVRFPLQRAIEIGNYPITQRLLAAKADPDKTDDRGNPPIAIAVSKGHHNITKLLLDFGADQETQILIVSNGVEIELNLLESAATKGDAEMARILVDQGIRVTPMSFAYAINSGHAEFLSVLIASKQVDINKEFPQTSAYAYMTPLMLSVISNTKKCFDVLLEAGADLLTMSVKYGSLELMAKKQGFIKPKGYIPHIFLAALGLTIVGICCCFQRTRKKPSLSAQEQSEETPENKKTADNHKKVNKKSNPSKKVKKDSFMKKDLDKKQEEPPKRMSWEELTQNLEEIRDKCNSKMIAIDKEAEKSREDSRTKYFRATNISDADIKAIKTEAMKFIESRAELESISKDAAKLLEKKPLLSDLEEHKKLESRFNRAMHNLPTSGVDLLTLGMPPVNKNPKFFDDDQDSDDEAQSISRADIPDKPPKTYQNTWRLSPPKTEPSQPSGSSTLRERKIRKPTVAEYINKMKLVSKLIAVFNEAGLDADTVTDLKKSKSGEDDTLVLKFALLFAMQLVSEVAKRHFTEDTTPRIYLENIRNNLGHAINQPLENNLSEIVPAVLELFQQMQLVTEKGFDPTRLQTFENPLLNMLIKQCIADEKPIISASMYDRLVGKLGTTCSKEDGSTSAMSKVNKLALEFLLANPAIRDRVERYHSTGIAAVIRTRGNKLRHDKRYEALKFLQKLLSDFTPADENTLRATL